VAPGLNQAEGSGVVYWKRITGETAAYIAGFYAVTQNADSHRKIGAVSSVVERLVYTE
jgi:hypothetical protein